MPVARREHGRLSIRVRLTRGSGPRRRDLGYFGMLYALGSICLEDPKPNILINKNARPNTSKRVTKAGVRPSASPNKGPGKPSTNKLAEVKNREGGGARAQARRRPRERNRASGPRDHARSAPPGYKRLRHDIRLPPRIDPTKKRFRIGPTFLSGPGPSAGRSRRRDCWLTRGRRARGRKDGRCAPRSESVQFRCRRMYAARLPF